MYCQRYQMSLIFFFFFRESTTASPTPTSKLVLPWEIFLTATLAPSSGLKTEHTASRWKLEIWARTTCEFISKVWKLKNGTNLNSIFCLIKSSEIVFIFLPAFYLIIWLMASPKNFEKIAILKIWQLVFFWGVKIYFGKLLLKWCIFSHGKNWFSQIMPFNSYYFHLM